jgi:hypothetical protein
MKLKITMDGINVQDIGFRAFLAEKALAWGIYNYQAIKAWPGEDQSKLIIKIEAEDKRIANFLSSRRGTTPLYKYLCMAIVGLKHIDL